MSPKAPRCMGRVCGECRYHDEQAESCTLPPYAPVGNDEPACFDFEPDHDRGFGYHDGEEGDI